MYLTINGLKREKTSLTKKQIEELASKVRELLKTLNLPNAKVGIVG